jgi:hypothetical protein
MLDEDKVIPKTDLRAYCASNFCMRQADGKAHYRARVITPEAKRDDIWCPHCGNALSWAREAPGAPISGLRRKEGRL